MISLKINFWFTPGPIQYWPQQNFPELSVLSDHVTKIWKSATKKQSSLLSSTWCNFVPRQYFLAQFFLNFISLMRSVHFWGVLYQFLSHPYHFSWCGLLCQNWSSISAKKCSFFDWVAYALLKYVMYVQNRYENPRNEQISSS